MIYDFNEHEREFGRIVFALILDRKKLTERIIIARADELQLRLSKEIGNVFYDETRPLGTLLINFENDKAGEWNKNAAILRESYEKTFLRTSARWKNVAPVVNFLQNKYSENEPETMFAAIRTWEEYLNCYNQNHGGDLLTSNLALLYKPFNIFANHKLWQENSIDILYQSTLVGESSVELLYPTGKRTLECLVATKSMMPIITYYLHKIEEWGYVFQHCKVCGKDFLARSRHYELCSDKCRKAQAVEAKREFEERTKYDKLEQIDKSAYYYWYNRLRKLRREKTANLEKLAVINDAFKAFRKEAVKRKNDVKAKKISLSDYSNWLFKQQDLIDDLAEKYYQ